jgi:hypothetical protein
MGIELHHDRIDFTIVDYHFLFPVFRRFRDH